jgi:hypothetical protein
MAASSSTSVTEPVWDLPGSGDDRTLDHQLVMNKHKITSTKVQVYISDMRRERGSVVG